MIWQDYVMGITALSFVYALFPQLIHGFKNKKTTIQPQTALITSLGLYAFSIATLTLNLYFSTIVNAFNATLWAFLFYQSIKYKKKG